MFQLRKHMMMDIITWSDEYAGRLCKNIVVDVVQPHKLVFTNRGAGYAEVVDMYNVFF